MFTTVLSLACGAEQEPAPGEAPRSLVGTEIDGRFGFDGEGQLIFDRELQRTFDYFLAADGELGPAELDAWVAELVTNELSDEGARAQVLDAWQAYRSFRAEAAAVLEEPSVRAQPEQAEQRLLSALEHHLGDAAIATHEREQIHRAFMVHRAYALPDTQARAAELARLSATEAQWFATSRAGRYLAGRAAIERAQLEQADAETIAALRQQHFEALAPGAAMRLAELDGKRAAWAERVSDFQRARERLRQQHADPAELEAAIAALEAELFSTSERRRLHASERALEQLNLSQP